MSLWSEVARALPPGVGGAALAVTSRSGLLASPVASR